MSGAYATAWRDSLVNPEIFWSDAAAAIDWVVKPRGAYDRGDGWFAGGQLNTCFNAVDRHVLAGRGDQLALIYDSPITGTVRRFTYSELLDHVGRTAGMLAALGVGKGDRVVIYMPMVPEAVFAMLACARIGAVHSVVFGGFAAPELAKRIDDAEPKLLLTASCGIEGQKIIRYKPLVDEALALSQHQVEHVVLLQREAHPADSDATSYLDWTKHVATAIHAPCIAVAADDPLYILYTSGTTGTPKGVVRENGGHAVALAWCMRHFYGVDPGETFWAASDVGWIVGHSFIVYGPLLAGATTVLFEGKPVGTPDAGTFWRTIVRHKVDIFFTAPTALRAIRKEDPEASFAKQLGIGGLRAVFLAGERADPDTLGWAESMLGVPVIDNWWQTELGWPATGTCLGLGDTRRRRGSAGLPLPGYDFAILDDDGLPVLRGATGRVAIRLPLPPGCFRSLWNNPAGYAKSFEAFEGYYETGDAGHIDPDGFINIMGRTDDIINVAGHRLSTGQMEQIIASQPEVAECAVIGADDPLKGMVPIGFAVAKTGYSVEGLEARIVARVRGELGAVAALRQVYIVRALPKTRSGKILRAVLRKLANGEPCPTPPTIEDPAVLDDFRPLFAEPCAA